jgi:hypothetical protein
MGFSLFLPGFRLRIITRLAGILVSGRSDKGTLRRACPWRRDVTGHHDHGTCSMDKLTFGLTMMVVGIGGTFLTLAILIWSIQLLKKIFPLSAEDGSKANRG